MSIRQQGVALVTSMIMLFLLMVLTLSSMRSTIMQDKMAFAVRDSSIALEAAESALRNAEAFLMGLCGLSDFTDRFAGLYQSGEAPSPNTEAANEAWIDITNLVSNFRQVTRLGSGTCLWEGTIEQLGLNQDEVASEEQLNFPVYADVFAQPQVYIELVGPVAEENRRRDPQQCGYECEQDINDLIGFRIYARGSGRTEFASRTISSFYARRF